MGKVSSSCVMHGVRGKVGTLVFREVHGETVVQAYGDAPVKRSALQQSVNDKMRMASQHAREALRNPAVKAHYEKKKKRLKVSSAYTAACTDFLRHGCIDAVDTSKYDEGVIVVRAFKADLGLEAVVTKVLSKEGEVLAAIRGVGQGHGMWLFRSTVPLPALPDVVIAVEAQDRTGNVTRVVQEFGKEAEMYHDWRGDVVSSGREKFYVDYSQVGMCPMVENHP